MRWPFVSRREFDVLVDSHKALSRKLDRELISESTLRTARLEELRYALKGASSRIAVLEAGLLAPKLRKSSLHRRFLDAVRRFGRKPEPKSVTLTFYASSFATGGLVNSARRIG